MKEIVEAYFGHSINNDDVVIIVPASFRDSLQQGIKESGVIAGAECYEGQRLLHYCRNWLRAWREGVKD